MYLVGLGGGSARRPQPYFLGNLGYHDIPLFGPSPHEGDTMGRTEVLRTIKDSESEAERIHTDAATKASETISNARVKASESSSTGRQSANDEAA